MRVSVLGGCGFIGYPLSAALADAGHTVTVFDRPGADIPKTASGSDRIKFVAGDFSRLNDVGPAIEGAEVVVHLISTTSPGSSSGSPRLDIETNVLGSVYLLDCCVKAAVRKVVFASSGGTVYGVARSLPIAETHPLDPINAYGFSKVMVEKCLGLYQHQFGIDHTILRIANPYGERQRSGTGQGVIAAWMDAVRRKSGVEIWGDGSVVRDYVYIQDVVKALLLAVEESTGEKVINIGSGVGHSLVDVHGMLERVVGHDIPITFADRRSADAPANVLDVSLAKSALAWRPEMSLEDGLATVWRRTSQRRLSVT